MANIDLSVARSAPRTSTPEALESVEAGVDLDLHPAARPSLIEGREDMAALLANVMRRQTDRRVEKPAKTRTSERPDAMSDAQRTGLARMRLLINSAGTGFGSAYEHARGLFPDPEELALVLAGLREDSEINAKVRAEIDAALASLIREYGHTRICMGLNTRHVVNAFAAHMNIDGSDLRRAYRTLAGATAGEAVTYRYLIDTFGFARRGLALDFLEQALAADIASDTPTHPPEAFQPLLALLFQLRLLRSADALLLSGSRHRQRQGRGSDANQAAIDLFDQALIHLLITCLSDIQDASRQFAHCMQRWRAFTGDENVSDWAGRILRSIAELPCELFPDLAYRQALMTSLCEVVDSLFRSRRDGMAKLRSLHV